MTNSNSILSVVPRSTDPDFPDSINSNDFYSTPPLESEQDWLDHPERFNGQFEYRFILPFAGPYVFGYSSRGVGRCKVVLRNQGEWIHVLVYEPKDTGTISVTNFIEHIATQIYWGFLRDRDPRRITWTLKYRPEDMRPKGGYLRARFYWNGYRFWYNADTELGSLQIVPRKRLRDLFWPTPKLERVSRMSRPDFHAAPKPDVIPSPENEPFDYLSFWESYQESPAQLPGETKAPEGTEVNDERS